MSRAALAVAICASLLLLAGCENLLRLEPAAPAVVDTGCAWARAIRPTAADWDVISDKLVREISDHNETGAVRCGWRPGQ